MSKKTQRLVQWFGANTENAPAVGKLLSGCRFVGIPFGGGMSEVPFIGAKQILVGDLHRHIINLCAVVANDDLRAALTRDAGEMPYHPDILKLAQQQASSFCGEPPFERPDYDAALAYFVCVWMGRGGKAGTDGEFTGGLPIRWNANGGGSNQRYRTAIEALDARGQAFRRCEFVCMDGLEFVRRIRNLDQQDDGLYVDPPWPGLGDGYRHKFSESDQRELARLLSSFRRPTVVVRFGEHPLIRELYPEADWTWMPLESRTQANERKAEFLIVRKGVS